MRYACRGRQRWGGSLRQSASPAGSASLRCTPEPARPFDCEHATPQAPGGSSSNPGRASPCCASPRPTRRPCQRRYRPRWRRQTSRRRRTSCA
ncbi:hypothetical protein T492DRAFT_968082 [Pavlovales sp. CCMP2436]|nr:hypothetical protein T492DRAFT_968082 [Pavlovales sp. CCMP2436]